MKHARIKDWLATKEEVVTQWTLSLAKWVIALTISGWLIWSEWEWQERAIAGVIGVLALLVLLLLSRCLKWEAKERKARKRLEDALEKGPEPLNLDRLTFQVLQEIAGRGVISPDDLVEALGLEGDAVLRSLAILEQFRLVSRNNDLVLYGQLFAPDTSQRITEAEQAAPRNGA